MSDTEMALSFDEFPVPAYEDWYAAAVDSLDGASFEKALTTPTYEGLTLQPLYRREDTAEFEHAHTLPGLPPFVRGTQAAGYASQPWQIAQAVPYTSPQAFNEALRSDLERGQNAIVLEHVSLNTTNDLAQAFAGVDLTRFPILRTSGTNALPFAALLAAHPGSSVAELVGCAASDPLGELARTGALPLAVTDAYGEMAQLTLWAVEHAPNLRTVAVNADVYHNAGANAVQELAFAIAAGVEYIRRLQDYDLSMDAITQRIQFTFAIGSQFFTEVAKLRAARLLWAQIIAAFGGSDSRMYLHTRTGAVNKTVYAPYENMLRTTIEAFAGAAGGTHSMQVEPFDSLLRQPDEFSRRIARNQQLILQHEANLTRTIDPAGGAYYIEYLTDWLAQQAWGLFQEVERRGGLLSALQAGFVQEQVSQAAEQRKASIERRKDVLVGINMYPNPSEEASSRTAPPEAPSPDSASQPATAELNRLRSVPPEQQIDAAVDAARAGAGLDAITSALRAAYTGTAPSVTPLRPFRLAEPYETLRQNAAAYRQRTGAAPRIFLASLGSYRARADFTTGFFEVGGFEIVNQGRFASPEAAAQAALVSGAQAVVICSTDDNYPQIVAPLVSHIRAQNPDITIILAGYPQDQIEAHRAAGIDEFIHIRANCCEVNRWLQQRIGVSA
jgi:methylmalonyl-CoA mutase